MATHQPHCSTSPNCGYFGKPTKSRNEEPSMYEILTWNVALQRVHEKRNYQTCQNGHKCSHENSDHIEEGEQLFKGKNYQRKDIPRASEPQISKNRRQSQRVQSGNSPISKKNLQHQYSQKDLIPNRSPLKQRTIISNTKQRPQSAKKYQQKVTNNHNKTSTPPNYMKEVRNNSKETSEERENRMFDQKQKKIQKFVQTTRWIPNSAFTTYFGKPAFENYGRANTNPTSGGILYGNYLKSHNVQPHRGQNSPDHVQSYSVALMKAKQIGQICPYPPKMNKIDMEVAEKQFEENNLVERSPICAQKSDIKSFPIRAPPLAELEKFGGKGIQKVSRTRFSAPNGTSPTYCEW